MDRTLVIKLDIRQSEIFDDVLAIVDDFSDAADMRLATALMNHLKGASIPDSYKHADDLIEKLAVEMKPIIERCTSDFNFISLGHCERSPLKNVLTLYVRIEI